MAWNDQGGRDPWGGGNQQPPDLDEAIRKLKEKMGGIFGGSPSGGPAKKGSSNAPIIVGIVVAVLYWAWQGVYLLDESEQGVVLRFGQYQATIGPGFNWQPAVVDTVLRTVVTQERQYTPSLSTNLMLTKDDNIVQVPMTVQYNIKDVEDYFLNVRDPDAALEQATDSAIRHVVGSSNLDNVISAGRELLSQEVEIRLQAYLDNYGAGIQIIDVTLQKAEPPEAVKAAFDDVIAAGADKERLINQAQAYRNQILPEARGRAQRALEAAQAYRGELIARAQGEASRFTQLLTEYERAPEVTRERLYLDTVEQVFTNSNKVMIDVEGGNNLMYLPLDQLTRGATGTSASGNSSLDTRQIVEETLNQLRSLSTSTSGPSSTGVLR